MGQRQVTQQAESHPAGTHEVCICSYLDGLLGLSAQGLKEELAILAFHNGSAPVPQVAQELARLYPVCAPAMLSATEEQLLHAIAEAVRELRVATLQARPMHACAK